MSYKNIFGYYISYKIAKNVQLLYVIINKIDAYVEESKENM